jgi:hypothetical protein
MIKGQTSILGVVILMGIVMGLVSATYLWAGPLIAKNIDKSNVNSMIAFMNTLNNEILDVASTGSSKVISANLGQASFVIDSLSNQIVIEMSSTAPMINSVTETPINFPELALIRENFNLNASKIDTSASLPGYNTVSHYNNLTLEGINYNISLFNSSSSNNFELLCIWNNTINQANDCAQASQSISKEGTSYEVVYINESGNNASFKGGLVENKGFFGLDSSGIVSAKGFSSNDKEYITLFLTYRALVNEEGVEFRILLNCSNNCAFSNEKKYFAITQANIARGIDYVNTTVNIEVE